MVSPNLLANSSMFAVNCTIGLGFPRLFHALGVISSPSTTASIQVSLEPCIIKPSSSKRIPKTCPFDGIQLLIAGFPQLIFNESKIASVFQILQHSVNVPECPINRVVSWLAVLSVTKLGIKPPLQYWMKFCRMSFASLNLPVKSISPGNEMKVSLPHGSNQKYPAMIDFRPAEFSTIKESAANKIQFSQSLIGTFG